PLAVFGITNDGLNLAVNLVLLFLFVLYFALIWWSYSDARRRIEDPMIVACATAASVFPFIGTVVYLIVRPPEYLEDVRERELEIAAAEARLAGADHHSCPYCNNEIEKSFLRCPNCMHRLKEPCTTCGKPLDPRWKICPYCEAEVGAQPQPQPARQRRTRRAAPAAEAAPQASGEQPPRRAPQRPAREDGPGREAAPQRAVRPAAEAQTEARPPRQGAPKTAPRQGAPKTAPRQGAPKSEPRQGAPKSEPRRAAPKTEPRQGRPAGQAERPPGDTPRERPTGDRARP
ncbi:MAG: double zinc ribbon domain-containing protein, partial [Thermoleophilaceae bacterium]